MEGVSYMDDLPASDAELSQQVDVVTATGRMGLKLQNVKQIKEDCNCWFISLYHSTKL